MTDPRRRADDIPDSDLEVEAEFNDGEPQDGSAASGTHQTEALAAEVADLRERLLRTLADMENLRKRTEREKAEATLYAATSFARDLLSVADSLDRAIASVPQEGRDQLDEATRNLLAGIEVTQKELVNVFSRNGITRIEPVSEKFDPHFHQAMFEVPDASSPPGTVVQVMQPGYVIGERCLRPAMVGVAKAPTGDGNGRDQAGSQGTAR
jgi:molecular chaperone GrpE